MALSEKLAVILRGALGKNGRDCYSKLFKGGGTVVNNEEEKGRSKLWQFRSGALGGSRVANDHADAYTGRRTGIRDCGRPEGYDEVQSSNLKWYQKCFVEAF